MNFDVNELLVIFANIVFEALPFIIVGALISGTLEELLPQQWLAGAIPRRRWLAVAGSALLGLVFPMCECGIVPVMRRLLGKGLPLACAVAYMLAAPIINPVVIASTWAAFYNPGTREDGLTSIQMVSTRVGLAFLSAVIVGLIVEWLDRRRGTAALVQPVHRPHTHEHHQHHHHKHERKQANESENPGHAGGLQEEANAGSHLHEHGHEAGGAASAVALPMVAVHEVSVPEPARTSIWHRLSRISATALHDFVDITCFLILGAFLAALFQSLPVMKNVLEVASDPYLAIPAMMLLAVLMCLCSEADAFVAANLLPIPFAGKVAFLVLGPMLDIKLYLMYTRVFKARLIWTIIPSVLACVFVFSLSAHLVYAEIIPWIQGMLS